MIDPGLAANLACILEATARKPGNVHRFLDFEDASYLDFLMSGAAIARPMANAGEAGLGRAILSSVEATRAVVAGNTNLGMILLLAPLAKAARGPEGGARPPSELPRALGQVLRETTREDARLAYRAIRLANPGGLGSSPDQDVRDEPTVGLLEAMALAAGRDAIARQYAEDFGDVFRATVPFRVRLADGWPMETAIIAMHLDLLSAIPDTLIARKVGPDAALEASARAKAVLEAGWPVSGRDELARFDAWLRADGHRRNPGATADLVTAALFVALMDGTIPRPRAAGPIGWSGPAA